jgi:phospholipase/lecithinase/hemolysin
MLTLPPSLPAWPAVSASSPNYAVGGAMTGTRSLGSAPISGNYSWAIDDPLGLQGLYPAVQNTGLDAQVALFATRVGTGAVSFDPATTLFSVWGGANDIFLGINLTAKGEMIDFDGLVISAASNVANRIGELASLGGTHFLVINLPDLGLTPFAIALGPATQAMLTGISEGFNLALESALANFDGSGLDIIEFDAFSEFQALIASAEAQGFITDEPCFDGVASLPTVLGGCPGYVYFDPVHPTTYSHSLIAASLYRSLPEPSIPALLVAALFAISPARRKRRRLPT